MAYPSLIPIPKEYGQLSFKVGQNKIRFLTYDGGAVIRNTLVYTVPQGKKTIVHEAYSVIMAGVGNPSGYGLANSAGTFFCYINMYAGGTVYGSLNLLAGTPIELLEGEMIYHVYNGPAAGSALYASILIEEMDK